MIIIGNVALFDGFVGAGMNWLLMGMIIVVGDDFSRRLRNRHRNVVELAN
jgi:hypothetical protein